MEMTSDGNEEKRHFGFYVATGENNPDLSGIAHNNKAWGLFANGTGFEQAIDSSPPRLRSALHSATNNATDSPSAYNKDAVFEFGAYEGKPNYQIYNGAGEDKTDSGVALNDSGV